MDFEKLARYKKMLNLERDAELPEGIEMVHDSTDMLFTNGHCNQWSPSMLAFVIQIAGYQLRRTDVGPVLYFLGKPYEAPVKEPAPAQTTPPPADPEPSPVTDKGVNWSEQLQKHVRWEKRGIVGVLCEIDENQNAKVMFNGMKNKKIVPVTELTLIE